MDGYGVNGMAGDILDADDTRLLVETGFIALSAGLDREAETIFEGARAARPGQEAGTLGLAMVRLARDEVEEAVGLLKGLPPSDAAMTYLGLALMRLGERDEAERLLRDVAATASDPAFAALAEEALRR